MATPVTTASSYWQELAEQFGGGWNRFWFTPANPTTLAGLRIASGVAAVAYLGSHTADLVSWFAADGMLPVATVGQLTADAAQYEGLPESFRWSALNYAQSSGELWTVHVLALVAALLFTAGCFTRITGIATSIAVLSYVHRAPMLTGQFEPILTMLLLYLCIGPCGAIWSVDAWFARRRAVKKDNSPAGSPLQPSVLANISLRLIQLHVAALYVIMGLSKLSGTFGFEYDAIWWRGEALWWLITRTESRLIDLTSLNGATASYFLNAWTHTVVASELAFGILIWNRLARPLLLVISSALWLLLAPVSGLVTFCLVMLIANLSFVPLEKRFRSA